MGRSQPTARQVLEDLSKQVERMCGLMPSGDAAILRQLIIMGRKHAPESSYAGLDPYIGFLIGMMLELYSMIRRNSDGS